MFHAPKILTMVLLAGAGGCTSKTVPDWAMYRPEQARKYARVAALTPHGTKVDMRSAVEDYSDVEMYTPEWYARERARDEALKKKFNICNGC